MAEAEWRPVTLGDVCELKRGYDLPKRAREAGDVPIVSSSGVTGHHSVSKVNGPGVVTGRYGTLGEVFYVEEDYWPLNTALYVRDFKENSPQYVAALLESMALGQHDGAAAVPGLNRNQLHTLPVSLPSRGTQDAVAEVLETLGDMIENNRRRVEVLEEMARTIYREWFVHFRFPGHEDTPFVDSDLGPIPEGWRPSTCGNELNYVGGGTPSKKEPSFWDDGVVDWFTPSDLTKSKPRYPRGSGLRITQEGLARSSAKRFPKGTVMMTSRATLGVLAIVTGPATTNQGFISVLPDDRWPPNFIREYLDASARSLSAVATGATFKEITKRSFKTFPFVVPEQRMLDWFRAATESLEQVIDRLEQSTQILTEVRDLLLPKLVTGQIDVSDLDLDAVVERGGV